MFTDVKDFIAEIDRRGDLARITEPMDPNLEMSALIDRVSKSPGGGPGLLFEKPVGSTSLTTGGMMPVAANIYGSMSRICLALGVNHLDEIAKEIDELLTPPMPRGFIDALISRITDAMLACPFLILAIALAAFLGPSLGNAMIAIGITTTPIFVRLTRGQVMSVKVEDYVEAARAMGNPRWRIALFHILPNIMPALLVQATLSIAAAIIAEAALSFLGLGQQPPTPSWGSMLNAAQRFLTNAPWMAIWPGLAIFLVVLSFNLVGAGLRDALDPRER